MTLIRVIQRPIECITHVIATVPYDSSKSSASEPSTFFKFKSLFIVLWAINLARSQVTESD